MIASISIRGPPVASIRGDDMRRTFVPPTAHVLDDERALPYVRRIMAEIHLLSDDSRILDAARGHILDGLVSRSGSRFVFRYDMRRGRPDCGPSYTLDGLLLTKAKADHGVWLEDLTAEALLFALQTMWREDLVRKVMES